VQKSIFAIVAFLYLLPQAALSQNLTAAQALEEAEIIYQTIQGRHPEYDWYTDSATWEAEMTGLRARQGPVSHVQQYFDLARLMSLATDTHTQIYPGPDTPGFETSFPLRFRLYEEGIYIVAADEPYRDLVGARVTSIDGNDGETIVAALALFASSDHPIRKQSWGVTYLLRHPATYHYMGWTNDDGHVEMALETHEGEEVTVELNHTVDASFDEVHGSGSAAGYFWPEGWRTIEDLVPGDVPLYRQSTDRNYWYTYLDGGNVLYFQLNRPDNDEDELPVYDFILSMFADIGARESAPERIIVDVRHNLGGWIDYAVPFSYMFLITDTCCTPGNMVVLAGRDTISAGSVFVGSMERATRAIVVGEPTGGRPYNFLGHRPVDLPYSGLLPEVPTYRLGATDSTDGRMYIAPDVHVPERFEDVIAGRDAALEAALNLTPEEARGYYPGASALYPWLRPSQAGAHPE